MQCHLAEAPSTSEFQFSSHLLSTQPTPTQPILLLSLYTHSTFGISPKSETSFKPLEAGISAKTLRRCPQHSVRPTTVTHLPDEDRQNTSFK